MEARSSPEQARLTFNLRQKLLAGLVSLQLVNVLHQNALVLEHVTLGPQVEAVVPAAQAENSESES